MKGLDVTVIKWSEVCAENEKLRFDPEFFGKEAIIAYEALRQHRRFGDLVAEGYRVVYETTEMIPREEGIAEGLPFFMQAADIETPFIRSEGMGCVSRADWERYTKGRIIPGEVLIEVKGLAEKVALVPHDMPLNTLVTGTCYKMQTHDPLDAYLLVAFLTSKPGQALKNRLKSNLLVAFVNKEDLFSMPVPNFGLKLKQAIADTIKNAFTSDKQASQTLSKAEAVLTTALGLGDWHPLEPLTYTRRASVAFAAGRLDSQYFTPRVAELLDHLGKGGRSVHDVAPPRQEKFTAVGAGDFRYIEISDVRNDGTVTSQTLPINEAPSRATSYVRAGDVLTSTVRPNRRLSALIMPEQDGCVASSGFVVLTPQDVPAELLLTYLRLPLFCELMDLHTSASLYPAISEKDLLALPFPIIPTKASNTIVATVRSAHTARHHAHGLLAAAQLAVEIAIKDSEVAALAHLKAQGNKKNL